MPHFPHQLKTSTNPEKVAQCVWFDAHRNETEENAGCIKTSNYKIIRKETISPAPKTEKRIDGRRGIARVALPLRNGVQKPELDLLRLVDGARKRERECVCGKWYQAQISWPQNKALQNSRDEDGRRNLMVTT
ncbi:hypothetical protein Nepgr_003220 [Nepenthes gracilis]|uniref:Uncharacterized protein n=1 Tax=Nepenthes gracilis TaxID=150966 RepID=A0AAD3XDJ5_NEPGR|nr:hypothetical protein Nepgr_003220 [Nepenthes gracilis]